MTTDFLDTIIEFTRQRVASQREHVNVLRETATRRRPAADRFRLSKAVARTDRINVIAEIKRASPSKGVINKDVDIAETALAYKNGGACAISVLTEERYFMGSLEDLHRVCETVTLPVLRKDFIIDECQIYEAASAGADAVLLIAAALSKQQLRDLHSLTRDELGMDALVEVHALDELEAAVEAGAKLVGVNNRDLRSLSVSFDVSRELIRYKPPGTLMIAESGISFRGQIDELRSIGFDGFLVGESLMRGSYATKLSELVA